MTLVFLNLVVVAVAVLLGLACGYLLLLTVAAAMAGWKDGPDSEPLELTVVVPAHNESGQIADTVASVLAADYPPSLRRVIVLADNCTDDTAEVARQAGAQCLERSDPRQRGKGQALNWLFTTRQDLLDRTDAVVIVDADTQMDPEFLKQVSDSLSREGVQAVQGYYGASNIREGWRPALMEAALAVFHHLRPLGRNRLGATAGLRGNGMAFDAGLIRKLGWPAFSIVEDVEFTLELLMQGIRVEYNPSAKVAGEMASGSYAARTQRSRWEGGRFGLLRTYGWRLLRRSLRRDGWPYADALLDLAVPPLAMLVLLIVAFLGVSLLMHPVLSWVAASYLLVVAAYVAAGLVLRGEPWAVWSALLRAPFFVLWKIPVYVKMLCCRQETRWVRTPRRHEKQEES